MSRFASAKSSLADDWDTLQTTFETNTAQLIEAIRRVPDSELDQTIQLPWGAWTIAHLMGHPYWNMAYHEGQINYIASLLIDARHRIITERLNASVSIIEIYRQ